jgi:predicted CXXCH cytochrome family protein
MRKLGITLLAMALALVVAVMVAPNLTLAVDGGHKGIANDGKECSGCHAPHNTSGARPLFDQAFTGESYTTYPETENHTPGDPGDFSKACLSCHDGTDLIADTNSTISDHDSAFVIGTNLRDDHPIGFEYTASGVDDLESIASVNLPFFSGNNMECGTCHDPHDNSNNPYLRLTYGTDATLCDECHLNH